MKSVKKLMMIMLSFCIIFMSVFGVVGGVSTKDVYALEFNTVIENWGVKLPGYEKLQKMASFKDSQLLEEAKQAKKDGKITANNYTGEDKTLEAELKIYYTDESGTEVETSRFISINDCTMASTIVDNFTSGNWKTFVEDVEKNVSCVQGESPDRKTGIEKDAYNAMLESYADIMGSSSEMSKISTGFSGVGLEQSSMTDSVTDFMSGTFGQIFFILLVAANLFFTLQCVYEIVFISSTGLRELITGASDTERKWTPILGKLLSNTCLKSCGYVRRRIVDPTNGKRTTQIQLLDASSEGDVDVKGYIIRKCGLLVFIVFFWVLIATGLFTDIGASLGNWVINIWQKLRASM